MAETPYNHYALYEPDASPDLTATGEYNRAIMGIDSDMHAEQVEREHADKLLDERIDNAEAEISANSADLTGIKSLTYGNEHVQFLENDNGSYSSPALDEIKHEIDNATVKVFTSTAGAGELDTALTLDKIKDSFYHSVIVTNGILLNPFYQDVTEAIYTAPYDRTNQTLYVKVTNEGTRYGIVNSMWADITGKPFSTIGSGLKVESDALTIDASALPSGITVMQLSEFGELTYDEARPYIATGEGNAAAYAKMQKAWPNVVVVDGSTTWTGGMYTPAMWSQAGYMLTKGTFTNSTSTIPAHMKVTGSDYSGAVTLEEIVATGLTPDTQWGKIEQTPPV